MLVNISQSSLITNAKLITDCLAIARQHSDLRVLILLILLLLNFPASSSSLVHSLFREEKTERLAIKYVNHCFCCNTLWKCIAGCVGPKSLIITDLFRNKPPNSLAPGESSVTSFSTNELTYDLNAAVQLCWICSGCAWSSALGMGYNIFRLQRGTIIKLCNGDSQRTCEMTL